MNRRLIAVVGALFGAGAMAGAQSTEPSVYVDAPPATQAPAAAEGQSVLVCPVSTPSGNYWFSTAFQRDVATDLSQMSRLRVLAPDSLAPAGNDEALRRAREAGAAYVLVGQARRYGNSMQVTGDVLDVNTGRSVANLNSTAPEDNLFPLEDTIALQAAQALPGSLVTRSAAAATQPAGGDVNGPPYISELNPGGPPPSGQPGYAPADDNAGAAPYGYPAYSYYPPGPYYYPYANPYYYPYWGYGWGASIVFVPGYGWCHYHPAYYGYGYYHGPYYRGYYYGSHYYYGPRYYGYYGHYGPYYHGPVAHGYGGAHPGGGGAHGGGGHGGGGHP